MRYEKVSEMQPEEQVMVRTSDASQTRPPAGLMGFAQWMWDDSTLKLDPSFQLQLEFVWIYDELGVECEARVWAVPQLHKPSMLV